MAERQADLIVTLFDVGTCRIECKVSSRLNSIKRLNKDSLAKFMDHFLRSRVDDPAGGPGGGYNLDPGRRASNVWSHKLEALAAFVKSTKS